jgi:acyl-coenzyme A synthetase/AMP-(fatty) acid ligase
MALDTIDATRDSGEAAFMATPGFVFFTSGSTGLPRPVFRTRAQLVDGAHGPARMLGLAPGTAVLATLPLDRLFGMHHGLLLAAALGGQMTLLREFRHRAVLGHFAARTCQYWAGTPVMADTLSRCVLPAGAPRPHPAPALCITGGRLSGVAADAFRNRFGVPLRPLYGTTETGTVSVDAAAPADVRPESAGWPMPGVRLSIGDDPGTPLPPGRPGRVWIRSAGCAPGYGFPPAVTPLAHVDGWWASPDVGFLDGDGRLHLVGRVDDCVRTRAGHILSPAMVAGALEAYPGVTAVVVVPLGPPEDPALAALCETPDPLDTNALRSHLARLLPDWSQPRPIEQTRRLPRLPSGKPDRLACIALLRRVEVGSGDR